MAGGWGISPNFHRDQRIRYVGLRASGLWIVCLLRFGVDFVPQSYVRTQPHGRRSAKRLVAAGLWVRCRQDGQRGYRFIEWADLATRVDDLDDELSEGW